MSVILVIAVAWLFLLVLGLAILRAAAVGDRNDAAVARQTRSRRRRARARKARSSSRTAFLGAVALSAGAAALAATAEDASAQTCARSGPGATVCLINAERRARGLSALAVNARLARAAGRHARDMVARSYFSHDSPSGASFSDRLRRAGYARRCSWSGGETLAWGTGSLRSARSRVAAWMHSAPHRAILLSPGFREVGIGIAAGAPGVAGAGLTYVGEFGRRRC